MKVILVTKRLKKMKNPKKIMLNCSKGNCFSKNVVFTLATNPKGIFSITEVVLRKESVG